MKKIWLFFLAFAMFCFSAKADDKPMIGIFGGVNLNSQVTDFDILPGKMSTNFRDADIDIGIGSHFGILFQYPITSIIDLGIRCSYNNMGSELSKDFTRELLLADTSVIGSSEERLKLHLKVFTFEPNFTFHLYKAFHLLAGFGFNFVSSHREEFQEKVTSPNGAVFPNNSKADNPAIRHDTACKLSNVPTALLSANFGAYFDFPLNADKSLILSPGVYYNFGLTDYVKDYNWRINQAQISIAVKYAFSPFSDRTAINEQIIIDTVTVARKGTETPYVITGIFTEYTDIIDKNSSKIKNITHHRTDTLIINDRHFILEGDIRVNGVDSNGREVSRPQYISHETIANRNQPMLNYIFFDSMDYRIPQRYNLLSPKEIKNFNIKSLYNKSNIETYYDILNIIGWRMSRDKYSTITLTGCNSGIGPEKWNSTLSTNRATAIANYLSSVWNINPKRINIMVKGLPDKFSYPANQFLKAQENRRVEISSDNYEILSPLFVNDTTIEVQPPVARFKIDAKSSEGFKDWQINITKPSQTGGNASYAVRDAGIPPKEKEIALKSLTDSDFDINDKLYYSLNLSDVDNNKFSSPMKPLTMDKFTIPMRKIVRNGNKEIERYSLILFDFTSNELSERNKRTIAHVKNSIKPTSSVKIIGYTDTIGDANTNRALSLKRAKATYRVLDYPNAIVEGRGEDVIQYDNDLPEGRIFSRTVEIIIETPVNNN